MKIIILRTIDGKEPQNFKLKVTPNHKIIDIKAQLKQITGLYIKEQKLLFDNREMEDNKRLKDYFISDGSTLNLSSKNSPILIQIYLFPPFGKPLDIEVQQDSDIIDVKNDIYNLLGIPPNQQQISNSDKIFDDDTTVLKVIPPFSNAKLTFSIKNPKTIYVKKPKSDPIQIIVGENNTIDDIKYEITIPKMIGLQMPKCELTFLGIRLEDSYTINDYLIPENATLNFIEYQHNGIIIFIKVDTDNYIPLEVNLDELILTIKKQINEIYGISTQQKELYINNVQLDDIKSIRFYRVRPYQSIELKSSIQVFFKLPYSDYLFSLHVDPQIKINELKMIIEKEKEIKSSDQNIIFQCKRLEDNFTIHHYSITNESILLISPTENDDMKITVSIEDQNQIVIEENPTIFVSELKSLINKQTGIPIEKQAIYHQLKFPDSGFTFLDDNESLLFYSDENELDVSLRIIKRGGFFIFIKISCNQFLPMEVLPNDNYLYIKTEIQKKTGIPINQQRIDKDEKKISESSISPGKVLYCARFKEGSVCVFVRMWTAQLIPFYVCLNDDVNDLKKSIKLMEGFPVEEQRLIYEGKELKNEYTLESYNIQEFEILNLSLRLRG